MDKSWTLELEFLHWQYEKSRELSESKPQGGCQYNQVAGEFQQFQVLVQRFLENEPFQGPRVQNYVKSRCVNRNFLQVPASNEDCLMDKEEERSTSDGISSEMLTEIMEKSIRIFWNFIKADKSETNGILKGILQTETELQDQKDLELLIVIRADLQKVFSWAISDDDSQDIGWNVVDPWLIGMIQGGTQVVLTGHCY